MLGSPNGADVLRLECRAVLVDLDGTLVDSAPPILRIWESWSARNGVDYNAVLRTMHGRRSVDTIRLVAPWLEPEHEAEVLEAEEVGDTQDVKLFPGAARLFSRLQGRPHAIVTSGSRRLAEARLRHVGLPFPPVLITADEPQAGKPAPDAYLLAAGQLGVEAADCVVIEDSPVGVEAGKAAAMRVVGVASTHPAEQLTRADVVVNTLEDLALSQDGDRIELLIRD